jgi:hypothetical protein
MRGLSTILLVSLHPWGCPVSPGCVTSRFP